MNKVILFLYSQSSLNDAETIKEHIFSFGKYSEYKIEYINVFEGFKAGIHDLNIGILVLHYSLFGTENYILSPNFLDYIENFREHKIAIFQDEGWYFKTRLDFVNKYKINTIFTCFQKSEYEKTYLKYTNVKNLITTIPGYVSEDLLTNSKKFVKSYSEREIDISYRSRNLPFFVGEAGIEKTKIGEYFNIRLKNNHRFNLDIKIDFKDRLYGDDWYRFLANSKAVLGVESGYSIVDIHNNVSKLFCQLKEKNKDLTYEEFCIKGKEEIEKNSKVFYRTISPRHFEAAAFKCVQILFEGSYSNILVPWKHYIPLKKDFSNFQEVIFSLSDVELINKITNNCYEDLILSKKYSYNSFIHDFDKYINSLNLSIEKKTNDTLYINNFGIDLKNYNKNFHSKQKYNSVGVFFEKNKKRDILLILNIDKIKNNIEYFVDKQNSGTLICCLNNCLENLLILNVVPDIAFVNVEDIRPVLYFNKSSVFNKLQNKLIWFFTDITSIEMVELISKFENYVVKIEDISPYNSISESAINLFRNRSIVLEVF